jgi:cytosine/adenosine deaminase-related metal-dependent hydrolase
VPPDDGELGSAQTLWELARWGSTTFVEVGCSAPIGEALIKANSDVGLRAYVGLGYRSGDYRRTEAGTIEIYWKDDSGARDLEVAVEFIRRNRGTQNGRIQGMLVPLQADACLPQLLERTVSESISLDVGIQTHVAQNLFEFHEIVRRTGDTPVAYLARSGMLTKRTIVGHCLLRSGHPWTAWPGDGDTRLLRDAEVSVAHCPLAYARRGMAITPISEYVSDGINVGLGTDTYPRDIVEEMRWASMLGKALAGDATAAAARMVFDAATIGGAKALCRSDLGRISVGAKADLVLVDLKHPRLGGPVYDPIRSLVEAGTGDVVKMTMVDGEIVHQAGAVRGLEDWERNGPDRVQAFAEDRWSRVPDWHWKHQPAEVLFPPSVSPIEVAELGRM